MHKIKLSVSGFLAGICLLLPEISFAQNSSSGQDALRAITTAVPILTVSPDARSAAMGDAGVAISPDANAPHWNPAKLGFIQHDFSIATSYSPWLRNIINDMSLSYVSAVKNINDNSSFSLSLLYFNLGSIQFTDANGNPLQDFRPKEYTIDAAYGQRLSDNLSLGLGARFIHSNLAGGISITSGSGATATAKPGNSVAADLGIYYTKDLVMGGKDYNLSFGGNVSNLGAKISYNTQDDKDFIPTNLRLGTAFTMNLDPFNKITLTVDGNKLLVPSPSGDIKEDSIRRAKNVLGAVFSSFSDAPDGFSEEISEINISAGAEYWYDNIFAARAGYFYEDPNKGNRQYFSMGLGIRYQKFGLDAAYLVPTGNQQSNPLANTIRFTLMFNVDKDEASVAPAQ
ncbi:type IX secretion system outer membrane channel protein PorV [Adhaeribacter sp. BT258]|uniref:Type IX secretion system outer membrane channel protein PorV n=1 Tax=Adhaeribacter terrigena TaxID=2793070 RepID=A0ABS1BWW0_9BACT|nr:type IX secretion system outer membrane channel protein PorV [Adhaeribacter terrigena]MBK0401347.1 type IX secretion system outer membrane channel protein PorV [Adhaeribacter terrigena]